MSNNVKIEVPYHRDREVASKTTLEEVDSWQLHLDSLNVAERAAMVKWNELSLEAVRQAKTFTEAKKAWKDAPGWGSEAKKAAILKWIELCTTAEEAEEIYNRDLYHFGGWEIKDLALAKWNELSLEAVRQAKTFAEVEKAWSQASFNDSIAKKEALKKWLRLVNQITSIAEAQKAFLNTIDCSETAKTAALTKWNELSLEAVRQAKTFAEAKKAWKEAPGWGSEAKKAAILKWIELCTTVAETKEALEMASHKEYNPEMGPRRLD